MSNAHRPVRAVIAKIGLDGHDRGAKVVSLAMRDAGYEVIYTGLRRTAEEIAATVLDEDADVLGLSILSGAVKPLTLATLEALRKSELDDVIVVVGGIISPDVSRDLIEMGVDRTFGPGSSMSDVIAFLNDEVGNRRLEPL